MENILEDAWLELNHLVFTFLGISFGMFIVKLLM